ncbi:MAG TPA: 50S ribosomal protein L4 [Verrucomicrobia bacterium]|nr:50S ribosomal protein L4 [Verrucomicrobiota bacterium]HOP98460.1 50S ribosomal protein L4 [Verrucomicrobiota bacterium]HPU55125.1 50S ribosomal protein L4 [Verrucomicrobiota bacterium]
MKIAIKDIKGKDQGEVEVSFPLVEDGRGTQAVHDAVVAYRAAQRMGTASTKTMGEVAGSGKKPWRQKGTGRARAGSFRSPLWRGGGVVFGPKPRDYRKKVNARTRRLALRKALSERLKAGDVVVVNDLKLESPKTKEFLGVLSALDLKGTALIVAQQPDRNLTLASRNVPTVALATSENLNTYDVLRPDKLVFTKGAFESVSARLAEE